MQGRDESKAEEEEFIMTNGQNEGVSANWPLR